MISTFEQLNKLFREIDKTLKTPVHFYIIGGAVLLYYNLKTATKDVDIIVDTRKEFITTEKTLKHLNFTTTIPTKEYEKFDISQIFTREDFRIDLFEKTVCKGFALSEGMKKRAKTIQKLPRLTISLCSPTDIFLFKTFTEREGDIADCISLTGATIEWDSMMEEINTQIKTTGNTIWITYIGERMDILAERGITIPIMKTIDKLRDEYFDEYEKRISKQK